MGIHHTYKSKRGERSLAKQLKQEELRKRAQQRQQQKQQPEKDDVYVLSKDEVLTLDHLTNPNSK